MNGLTTHLQEQEHCACTTHIQHAYSVGGLCTDNFQDQKSAKSVLNKLRLLRKGLCSCPFPGTFMLHSG